MSWKGNMIALVLAYLDEVKIPIKSGNSRNLLKEDAEKNKAIKRSKEDIKKYIPENRLQRAIFVLMALKALAAGEGLVNVHREAFELFTDIKTAFKAIYADEKFAGLLLDAI
jgi:hypothetical protein